MIDVSARGVRSNVIVQQNNDKFAEVFKCAIDKFGDIDKALSWFNESCSELGGQVPIHLVETADGAELVIKVLDRIEQAPSRRSRKKG